MNENEQTSDMPENASVGAAAAMSVEIPGGTEVDPSAVPEAPATADASSEAVAAEVNAAAVEAELLAKESDAAEPVTVAADVAVPAPPVPADHLDPPPPPETVEVAVPVIDAAGALAILDQTEQGLSGFHGVPVSASSWLAVKFGELRAALQ
jgi:hypothetical protein